MNYKNKLKELTRERRKLISVKKELLSLMKENQNLISLGKKINEERKISNQIAQLDDSLFNFKKRIYK